MNEDERIKSLMERLKIKDAYTMQHSVRVAELSIEIGKALKLSESDLEKLAYNAVLHDIGKLLMPDNILKSSEKVSDRRVVQKHIGDGAGILSQHGLEEYAVGAMYHHSYFDNLNAEVKGKCIPLFGRIIAVADAYDAMTTDRPYRTALGTEEACRELQRGSGSQFDPNVVAAFFAEENKA